MYGLFLEIVYIVIGKKTPSLVLYLTFKNALLLGILDFVFFIPPPPPPVVYYGTREQYCILLNNTFLQTLSPNLAPVSFWIQNG